jgi:hypothetical protein
MLLNQWHKFIATENAASFLIIAVREWSFLLLIDDSNELRATFASVFINTHFDGIIETIDYAIARVAAELPVLRR